MPQENKPVPERHLNFYNSIQGMGYLAKRQILEELGAAEAKLSALSATEKRLKQERDDAWAANERDRTKVADAITEITKVLRGREWLASSRGCYEFDDDEYQKEFGWAMEEIHKSIDGLRSVAADWSHSPKTQEAIDKARAALAHPVEEVGNGN